MTGSAALSEAASCARARHGALGFLSPPLANFLGHLVLVGPLLGPLHPAFLSMSKLYHQTDAGTAEIILRTQCMKPGSGGLAGGGIYFATTPELTGHKAHRHGVILEATVALGKIHTLAANGDPTMTLQKLKSMGFDSVCIARAVSSGHEYVVYDPGQVQRIIRDLSFKLDGTEWTARYASHGWLDKRHQHANRLAGQWAKRYFSINACGTFSYAKNEVARPKVELPLCDVAKVTPVEGDFSWGGFCFIISCPPVHLTVRADSLADRNRWIAGLIHHSRLWREKNGQIVRVATVATRGAGAVPGASAVPPKDEKTYTERSADVTQTRGDRGDNAPPRPPPADEEKVSGPWTLDCDEYENMAQLLTPLGRGEGPRLSKRRTAMDRSAGAVPSVQDGSSHFDRHAEAAQSRRARCAAELARAPAADGDGDGRQPAAVDDVKQTQSDAIRRNQTQSEQSDANGNQTQSDDDERRRNGRSSLKHAADAYAAGAISADEVCIVELVDDVELVEDDDDDDDDKLVSHHQPHRDVWG